MTPLAAIGIATAVASVISQIWSGLAGEAQAKQAKRDEQEFRRQEKQAFEAAQKRWDRTHGEQLGQLMRLRTGTENPIDRTARLRKQESDIEAATAIHAPQIARSADIAKMQLTRDFAERGISRSGMSPMALAEVENAKQAGLQKIKSEAGKASLKQFLGGLESSVAMGGQRPQLVDFMAGQGRMPSFRHDWELDIGVIGDVLPLFT